MLRRGTGHSVRIKCGLLVSHGGEKPRLWWSFSSTQGHHQLLTVVLKSLHNAEKTLTPTPCALLAAVQLNYAAGKPQGAPARPLHVGRDQNLGALPPRPMPPLQRGWCLLAEQRMEVKGGQRTICSLRCCLCNPAAFPGALPTPGVQCSGVALTATLASFWDADHHGSAGGAVCLPVHLRPDAGLEPGQPPCGRNPLLLVYEGKL